ncbi:MAG: methyltransferase domain-containing protein [Acidobacteriota bacterium]|jgi:demethylmenaquinone methyltransferase/2-methoxy-6-polyprenyl-1,4-benzoquinol methylase
MGTERQDVEAARAFYDRISRVYDAISDASEHESRERGLELVAPAEGEQILEVGFGTGQVLVPLARAVGSAGGVSGIDLSEGMALVARRRLEDAGLGDRVELRVGAAPPLPWPDSRFDAVTMSFTLELFPDDVIPELLAESRRVLRPGGRLGVVSMAVSPRGKPESALTHTYKWLHRHFPHIVDCRPIDAPARIRAAGFDPRQVIEMSIWTLPVVALLAVPTEGPP